MNIKSLKTIIEGIKLDALEVPENGLLTTEIAIDEDYTLAIHREKTKLGLLIHPSTSGVHNYLLRYDLTFHLGYETDSNVEPYEVVEHESFFENKRSFSSSINGTSSNTRDEERSILLDGVHHTRMVADAVVTIFNSMLPIKQELREIAAVEAKQREIADKESHAKEEATKIRLKSEAEAYIEDHALEKPEHAVVLALLSRIIDGLLETREPAVVTAYRFTRNISKLEVIENTFTFSLKEGTDSVICTQKSKYREKVIEDVSKVPSIIEKMHWSKNTSDLFSEEKC